MIENKKAQAGLDFLMTYGWALLIIVLVIGALFALGIFNVGAFGGTRATGFSQVGVSAWRLTPAGNLTAVFINRAGTTINVTNITYTLPGAATAVTANGTTFILSPGQSSSTINLTNATITQFPINSYYSIRLDINYTDSSTGFQYGDSGTLAGKAE